MRFTEIGHNEIKPNGEAVLATVTAIGRIDVTAIEVEFVTVATIGSR